MQIQVKKETILLVLRLCHTDKNRSLHILHKKEKQKCWAMAIIEWFTLETNIEKQPKRSSSRRNGSMSECMNANNCKPYILVVKNSSECYCSFSSLVLFSFSSKQCHYVSLWVLHLSLSVCWYIYLHTKPSYNFVIHASWGEHFSWIHILSALIDKIYVAFSS